MNIQHDLKQAIFLFGSASALARASGVAVNILTRFSKGERKGINSRTLEKLWPYLYGDKRPVAPPPDAQGASR